MRWMILPTVGFTFFQLSQQNESDNLLRATPTFRMSAQAAGILWRFIKSCRLCSDEGGARLSQFRVGPSDVVDSPMKEKWDIKMRRCCIIASGRQEVLSSNSIEGFGWAIVNLRICFAFDTSSNSCWQVENSTSSILSVSSFRNKMWKPNWASHLRSYHLSNARSRWTTCWIGGTHVRDPLTHVGSIYLSPPCINSRRTWGRIVETGWHSNGINLGPPLGYNIR